MSSLKRYWLREFILVLMALVLAGIPFALAFAFTGLLRRWTIGIGVVGFIVYYCTEQKVIPSATYDKLRNNQKRIVLWYRLTICVIFLFLISAVGMEVILRVLLGIVILWIGYLSTKRLINLRGR